MVKSILIINKHLTNAQMATLHNYGAMVSVHSIFLNVDFLRTICQFIIIEELLDVLKQAEQEDCEYVLIKLDRKSNDC